MQRCTLLSVVAKCCLNYRNTNFNGTEHLHKKAYYLGGFNIKE
ncbi:hypothetical protein FORC25_2610 [Clostridium perfringens]|nr:hypothetical protein FORC25_2610 [Clostridium perfringens]